MHDPFCTSSGVSERLIFKLQSWHLLEVRTEFNQHLRCAALLLCIVLLCNATSTKTCQLGFAPEQHQTACAPCQMLGTTKIAAAYSAMRLAAALIMSYQPAALRLNSYQCPAMILQAT